jgi:O-antigen ligase
MLIKRQSIASSSLTDTSIFTTFAIVFAAASTPLPTAWGSASLVFLLIAFFLQSLKKNTWLRIRRNSLAWAAMGLLTALAIGMLYGATPLSQAFEFWTKYLKLLAIPIIIGLAPDERLKRLALNAALTALVLSLLVSYARYFSIILLYTDPNQAYIGFQNRITFGLYASIASYIFAYRAIKHSDKNWKVAYLILFLSSSFNTLAVNNGRTGYVIFFALTAMFLYRNIQPRWRLPSAGVALITITALLLASPVSRDRIERSISNAETIQQKAPVEQSSTVIRWQFLKNSIDIIRSAPLFGHGTGSFESQYEKRIIGTTQVGSSNPHNDYLLILSQLGVFGLFFEIFFIATIYIKARLMNNESQEWAYALLVAFILYSGLNSTLLDAGEGRFFVVLLAIVLQHNTGHAIKNFAYKNNHSGLD